MRSAFIDDLPSSHFDVRDVESTQPQPGELKVRIQFCGICGTDLHILAGESYRPELPFVLGHEPVGTITGIGPGSDPSWLGKRITMTLFEGCGVCPFCRDGNERLCLSMRSIVGVFRRWGGFSDEMNLPADQAMEVPPSLDSAAAAALVDAGATAANAAAVVIAQKATNVLVIGAGPVGFLLAQLLSIGGCEVSVVEPVASRQDLIRPHALQVVAALDGLSDAPPVVIDCAGAPGIAQWAVNRLPPHGLLVTVGYRLEPEVDFSLVARKELSVRGIRSGSRTDLAHVLDLAASWQIQTPPVNLWPLDRINEAFDALRSGQLAGKAVIRLQADEPALDDKEN
jgi:2-desacetyl-2-hydroxyethyl bacteriochlorophyllide A dehydrogenase